MLQNSAHFNYFFYSLIKLFRESKSFLDNFYRFLSYFIIEQFSRVYYIILKFRYFYSYS